MTANWEKTRSPYPLPPRDTHAVSPYSKGELDLRWSDPSQLLGNEGWIILGVNVYRSKGTDRGPFYRLNVLPTGGTFFRDSIKHTTIHNEVVDEWFSFGSQGEDPWRFKTKFPIARQGGMGEPSYSSRDVTVLVNGIEIPARSVFGVTGEVSLSLGSTSDPITLERWKTHGFGEDDVVTVSYTSYDPNDRLRSGVEKKSFYRISTVAKDPNTNALFETPLEHCPPFSDMQVESIDYIWKEGIRRNNWMLEQGGERVKFFVRRVNGNPCLCQDFDPKTITYGKQPDSLCKICFGTGYVGGYDGPYDLIIAPDEAERKISQLSQGRRKEHQYEVWIGPSPIVSQRDFIVKQNNDRYSIGAVRYPSNRGSILQQHFNISYLDSGDIRYTLPIDGVPSTWGKTNYSYNPQRETYDARTDPRYPIEPDKAYPMLSEKDNLSSESQVRGRTGTWENQNH